MEQNLLKELENLITENRKNTEFRENLNGVREDLRKLYAELGRIISLIDPVTALPKVRQHKTVVPGTASSENDIQPRVIVREVYDKMLAGTHVTRHLLEQTYGVDSWKALYVMRTLKNMPGVLAISDIGEDGKKRLRLYYRGIASRESREALLATHPEPIVEH